MTSPAFSFYAKEWLAATLAWPLEARGAYMTLLAYQWDAGSVPTDAVDLARLLGVSRTKAINICAIFREKFVTNLDGKLINVRLEIERKKQAERRASLAKNGAKGGRGRKQKLSLALAKQKLTKS